MKMLVSKKILFMRGLPGACSHIRRRARRPIFPSLNRSGESEGRPRTWRKPVPHDARTSLRTNPAAASTPPELQAGLVAALMAVAIDAQDQPGHRAETGGACRPAFRKASDILSKRAAHSPPYVP